MIDPGSSGERNLVWRLRHRAHRQIDMPMICAQMGPVGEPCTRVAPSARELRNSQINLIAQWIDQGARDN